jgi:hypothetical protein
MDWFRPLQPRALCAFVALLSPALTPAALAAQASINTNILTASDAAPGDAFGRRVAVSGDTIVVGANGDDERGVDAGAAYVFERDASGAWIQKQKLLPPQLRDGDFFGWSVAIDDGFLVVGAPGDDRDNNGTPSATAANRGAAYVYRRVNGNWTLDIRLQPGVLVQGDEFGAAVAIDVPVLLVSSIYRDALPPWAVSGEPLEAAGMVWAYLSGPQGWQSDGTLVSQFPKRDGRFGFSLAIDAGIAVVGEPAVEFSGGSAQRYARPGNRWMPIPLSFFDGQVDGIGEAARFSGLRGIDTGVDGSVVVLDGQQGSERVRRVSHDGRVTTLFAVGRVDWMADALEADASGSIYLASQQSVVRRTPAGVEEVLATGFAMLTAMVRNDATGDLFVGDRCMVRRIAPDGAISNVAGGVDLCETVDGPPLQARFSGVVALEVDSAGAVLYVGEPNALRSIQLSTGQVQTLASGLGGLTGLARDGSGRLVVAAGSRLYQWDGTTLTAIAGSGAAGRPVDGEGSVALVTAGPMARFGNGEVAFLEAGTVRVLARSAVTTLAGVPWSFPSYEALSGYAVSLAGSRMLTGSPRAHGMITGTARAGEGRLDAWSPVSLAREGPTALILPREASPYARYGSGVAITRDRDVVLGPANGCLWTGKGACGDDAAFAPERNIAMPIRIFREDADRRWQPRAVLPTTGVLPLSGYGTALATDGRWLVAGAPEWDFRPQDGVGDIVGPGRVFVYDLDTLDGDSDGMPDAWEERFGLNPADPGDGSLDADGDGVTNREEFGRHTHPRNDPAYTRYFAEGATSDLFETRFALANPNDVPATVALRFTSALAASGTTLTLSPHASRKVVLPLDAYLGRADFSTLVESDQFVVADRLMTWNRVERYGSHGERATVAPSPVWYLAEGATHSRFDLFYLVQNPGDVASDVRVTYLRPSGPPLTKDYRVAARSRFTIWVNVELFPGDAATRPGLSNTDVSAVVESLDGTPIIVERAMYQTRSDAPADARGTAFEAGHASAGVTAPATTWFFAEGATGDFFDLFLLVANPHPDAVVLRGTYLCADGRTYTKLYTVPPASRFNIWVDWERFDGHTGFPLADVAVSTTLEVIAGGPVVAERAMWWPGPVYTSWTEAHNSAGATAAARRWGIAEGMVADTQRTDTYYLVANPSDTEARVRVTLLFEDGTAPIGKTFTVAAHSRFNVDVRTLFPEAAGKGFGAVIESAEPGAVPIVVEWSIYSDALGTFWAAGANALATPMP